MTKKMDRRSFLKASGAVAGTAVATVSAEDLEYLKRVRAVSDGASQFKEGWHDTQAMIKAENPDSYINKIADSEPIWLVVTGESPFGGSSHIYFNANDLNFTNIEHNPDSRLKIVRNGAYFSIFDNQTARSVFGKAFIIGSSDIGCFKLEHRNYPYIAVYKAEAHCQ